MAIQQKVLRVEFVNDSSGVHPKFFPLMDDSQRKENPPDMLSLSQLNLIGWKLEGFWLIWDERIIKQQVAIFTKEMQQAEFKDTCKEGESK